MGEEPTQNRNLILLLTLLLVATATTPLLSEGPGVGTGDDAICALPADASTSVDQCFHVLEGPAEAEMFGTSVATVGDVDGDGDDELVASEFLPAWNGTSERPGNYILNGRADGNLSSSDLYRLVDTNMVFWCTGHRWSGDINGDGHADMVSSPFWKDPFAGPEPEDPWVVHVRYGTPTGLPKRPDLVINITPEDIPPSGAINNSWSHPRSVPYGGVGDVNGDGVDDLCIYRIERFEELPHVPEEPPTFRPLWELSLHYGSEGGLNMTPDWRGTIGQTQWWPWGHFIHHGDVNGDGFSDIVLKHYNNQDVRVHFGARDGPSERPDLYASYDHPEWDYYLHAPVDLDGDEFDDVLTTRTHEGIGIELLEVCTFPGSPGGIPEKPASGFNLSVKEGSTAKVVDMNGDGLDDIVTWAYVRPFGDRRLHFQVFFNTGERFRSEPDWEGTVNVSLAREASVYPYPRKVQYSDVGDFDGDGRGDVVVGVPGENLVVFLLGGRLLRQFEALTLAGGPRLYAGYMAYEFTVDANPIRIYEVPTQAILVLDPGGANVSLVWNGSDPVHPFREVWDGDDLVTLASTAADAVNETHNHTVALHFRVLFHWDWPHEDECDAVVRLPTGSPRRIDVFESRGLFSVENDIDFKDGLGVTGEWQGALAEGDWVRGGENVTMSGPIVVYEGTDDVHPPDGSFDVALVDDGGSVVTAVQVAGLPVNLTLQMDQDTDVNETIVLTVPNPPGTAEVRSEPSFHLRVDGDPPRLEGWVPDGNDWQSSHDVLFSITANDTGTSGIDATALEYSYSVTGATGFDEWSRAGLMTTPSGGLVEGLVTLELPDGELNLVRWRVRDQVGNVVTSEDILVRVDTVNVTFSDPFPTNWKTEMDVLCGVTIRDMEGSGIDVGTIQYRYSTHNLSRYTEWLDWDEGGLGDMIEVSAEALIHLAETDCNYVQWRAMDLAGNGYTASRHHRVRVDATPIAFGGFSPPSDDVQGDANVTCWINASDGPSGSGVDLSTVQFQVRWDEGEESAWNPAGMTGVKGSSRFSVEAQFETGIRHSVRFKGDDVAGNGPTTSPWFPVLIDTLGPGFANVTPGEDEKQAGPRVTVGVEVTDEIVGVDASTVRYRTGIGGAPTTGTWSQLEVREADGHIAGIVNLTLPPSMNNTIQFRAADMLGNEAISRVFRIWVNSPPVAVVRVMRPVGGGEVHVLFAGDSWDPDGDELNMTWTEIGIEGPIGHGRDFVVDPTGMDPGLHEYALVVRDDMGLEDMATVTLEFESPPNQRTREGSGEDLLILLLIVAIVTAFSIVLLLRYKLSGGLKGTG